MKKWLLVLLLCLLPAGALGAVIPEELLHEAVLTMAWPETDGECWTEGHIVYGEEVSGDDVEVYAWIYLQNYGFMDGVFTNCGGGTTHPAVFHFAKVGDGYVLQGIEEPMDGTEYEKSIQELMPSYVLSQIRHGADREEMEKQMHKQAQDYLNTIGRSEAIQDWRERNLQLADMLTVASNEMLLFDPPYPLWVTSIERVEDGVRYVYSREWQPDEFSPSFYAYESGLAADGRTGLQILQKKRYDTGEIVETILIRAKLYELSVTLSDAYGEIAYTFAFDGTTYRQPTVRKAGECRVSYPLLDDWMARLPPKPEKQQTSAEIREENGRRVLCIAYQAPDGSIQTIECPNAVLQEGNLPQIDAFDRFLRLTYDRASYDFQMDDAGVWRFSQATGLYTGTANEYWNVASRNGALQLSYTMLENEGTRVIDSCTFPLLLMEEEFDQTAQGFDVNRLPKTVKGELTQQRAQRYADEYLPENLTAVSGTMGRQGIGLIVQDEQGKRWMYALREEKKGQFIPTCGGEVLPTADWDDFHTWNELMLDIGQGERCCSIALQDDGQTWGVSYIGGEDWFSVREHCLIDEHWNRYYGVLPCSVLENADLTSLPMTLEEAIRQLDRSGIAVVNNPDPADRLHLREKPDRSAKSFGKYYNGTPVRLLDEKGEWVKVSIGSLEGWMMKKYLAFGEKMDRVEEVFPDLVLRPEELEHGITVADTPNGIIKTVLYHDADAAIIGVSGDEWFHVVFEQEGLEGYVRQSSFWPGNG